MQLTADVSMYPFNPEFVPPIDGFIEKINTYSQLRATTYPTSTVLVGEYNYVTKALNETIAYCNEKFGFAVYVVKYIPDYEAL